MLVVNPAPLFRCGKVVLGKQKMKTQKSVISKNRQASRPGTREKHHGPVRFALKSEAGGQAVLLVIFVIGGVMLGATAIAGFLTIIQLQQSGDVANSAKAIFAA